MLVEAKTRSFSLRLDINDASESGAVQARLVYQKDGQPDEVIIEKMAQLSSIKQLMDGIFRELHFANQTKS